jgi:hypothetical protein
MQIVMVTVLEQLKKILAEYVLVVILVIQLIVIKIVMVIVLELQS